LRERFTRGPGIATIEAWNIPVRMTYWVTIAWLEA
jgi:hypothetical protein